MSKTTTSDFQKGMFIEFRKEVHQIVNFQHVNPGKGSAFVRTKLKNVKTGNTIEMQYLYKTDNQLYFMDKDNFEQFQISGESIADFRHFLKEGNIYQLYVHRDEILGLKPPKKVKLKVIEAEVGIKGNTVTGAKKTVLVETGFKVQVPLFIKEGDIIAINPETGEYLERVN